MKRFILFTILLMLFSVSLRSQPNTGNFAMQFDNGGITSMMYFYVPTDYDSTKSYPFIYGWHGAGMPGSNMRDMLYIVLAQNNNAIVCCPDANNLNGQPQQLLDNLINQSYGYTLSTYNIDTNKIVITGYSWGGRIAYELGLLNPQMFNGIIGLAPAIGSFTDDMWNNITSIRMATILGDQDFNYAVVNALMNQVSDRGGDILYKIKPGVEHVDNTYFNSQEFIDDYEECYQFVLNASTGVYEQQGYINEISIRPNPVEDFVNIEINSAEKEIVDIRLITLGGNEIYHYQSSVPLSNFEHTITLEQHQSGIYFAIIRIGNKNFYKKIIKMD
ncbi:T9SS type A sorting domain-containing protein [Bacteroidota bacterium]